MPAVSTGFLIYCKSKSVRNAIRAAPPREGLRSAAEAWRAMSMDARAPYEKKAAEQNARKLTAIAML